MKLEEFLDIWTRKNLTIILCESKYYDDMFDIVDDINDGKATIHAIEEYVICAIVPHYSQYREAYYIKTQFMDAEVTNFYVGNTAMIIWIDID